MQMSKMSLKFLDHDHGPLLASLLRLCYYLHYDVTKVISDQGCELSKYGVPNIFPEFLIRLTFKLNISKNSEPKMNENLHH